jgi:hypothetical protein
MTKPSNPNEDPGWPRPLSLLVFMLPGGLRSRVRRSDGDGLVLLRQVIVSFSVAIVLLGVVFPFVRGRSGPVLPWLAVLAVLAVAVTAIVWRFERPLDCSSQAALAGSYRTRFFLRVAFAETVALFAFVFAFIGGPGWIYYAGAAFTLIRFWTGIAPTRSVLAREQDALKTRGSDLSLIVALRSEPPSAAGGWSPSR